MEISSNINNRSLVLKIQGRLDAFGSKELEGHLETQMGTDLLCAVIDMAGVGYISSAGLRVFLLAAKGLGNTNGRMVLCSLKDAVKQVFDIAGFSSFLTLAGSTEEAINNI